MQNYRTITVLALAVVCQHAVSGLQGDREFFTTYRPSFDAGNQDKGFWPMVNVDRQNNRSKVDVHVPLVFDMTNDIGAADGKLDLSVLSGMVTVNKDKERGPNGPTGPLIVTVFGIPVYSGYGGPKGPLQRMREFFRIQPDLPADSSTGVRTARVARNEVTSMPTLARRANDGALGTISDTIGKLTTFVTEAAPILNRNGRPADKSDGFVAPSRFSESDFKPKLVVSRLAIEADKGPHETHNHH